MSVPSSAAPIWNKLRLALIFLLLALAAAYLGKGFYTLVCERGGTAPDLQARWRELAYIQRHINPYDLSASTLQSEGFPVRILNNPPPQIDPAIGDLAVGSGYPPWSFFWMPLFVWPLPLNALRAAFALINIAALIFLTRWFYRTALPSGRGTAQFAAASWLAISAHCSTLINGQFTLLLLVLLIGIVHFTRQNKEWRAGTGFAIALLKPTMLVPLGTWLLVERRWRALILTAGLTLLSSVAVGWWIHTSPLGMIRQMVEQTSGLSSTGYSYYEALLHAGLPAHAALVLCGLGGIALTAWLLRKPGPAAVPPELYILAVTTTIARLHIYHRPYDNSMIAFLLIALFIQATHRPTPLRIAATAAVGITLWLPGSWCVIPVVQGAQLVLWTLGLWLITRPEKLPLATASATR